MGRPITDLPGGVSAQPPAEAVAGRTLGAFLVGIFAAQVANNALTVSLPLILLHLGESMGNIGFITTLTTGIDMSGTLLGGWLTRRYSAGTILKAAHWARAAALLAIPAFFDAGKLTVPLAVIFYSVDALARGTADTASYTISMALVGKTREALNSFNSKARTAFNLGGIVGPMLVGLVALRSFSNRGNWLVAVIFALAAAAYEFIPPVKRAADPGAFAKAPSAPRHVAADRWLRQAFFTAVFLAFAPAIRSLIPPAFVSASMSAPSVAAWLVMAFGIGGTFGAAAFHRVHGRLSSENWIRASSVGACVLAAGLCLNRLPFLAAGIFVFAMLNEMSSLALTASIQERIPDGAEGGVMGLLRFSGNGTSMLSRLLLGLVFTAAAVNRAFCVIGAGLGCVALLQMWNSARLRRLPGASRESPGGFPAHGA